MVVATAVKGETLGMQGIMEILEETSEVREYSRQLAQKSRELEKATTELRAANERLQELDRLKDEIVATASHELRTPLTSIRAFSEILQGNPELERAQREEFLAIIVKETERLTRLLNDVLDLAKIESGRMEWHPGDHDLRDIVADAVASVSQLFSEGQIALTQSLPDTPAIALVDRDRMQQLVINLLSNACKFCPEIGGHVLVELAEENDHYRFAVTDNGLGIPTDNLERVFDKFHQASNSRSGQIKGTGLGLAISRGIAEHHGGRIWAENARHGGATFVCTVPFGQKPD